MWTPWGTLEAGCGHYGLGIGSIDWLGFDLSLPPELVRHGRAQGFSSRGSLPWRPPVVYISLCSEYVGELEFSRERVAFSPDMSWMALDASCEAGPSIGVMEQVRSYKIFSVNFHDACGLPDYSLSRMKHMEYMLRNEPESIFSCLTYCGFLARKFGPRT